MSARTDGGNGMLGSIVKRMTIRLPNDVEARLRQEAERQGTTDSQLIREAISIHLGVGGRRRLLAAKAGRSGRSDLSERIEQILRAEVGR